MIIDSIKTPYLKLQRKCLFGFIYSFIFSLRCSCFSKESSSKVGSLWPAASTRRNDYYFNRRLSTEGETNEFHKKDFLLTDFSSLLLLPLPSSAALLCWQHEH